VRRWLHADAIKPWRYRSWIFPRDPDFATKAARVLDLYASKGAVISLTKHLAVALAPNQIRVNAMVPGGILTVGSARLSEGTEMSDEEREAIIAGFAARVPLGRLGLPADFGGPAVFLASQASAYVTGAILAVDGGLILAT